MDPNWIIPLVVLLFHTGKFTSHFDFVFFCTNQIVYFRKGLNVLYVPFCILVIRRKLVYKNDKENGVVCQKIHLKKKIQVFIISHRYISLC